ncbi:hypothetical protein ABT088_44785 [Streptomyces mirabilis]|uniref:hypothetical protein n=1 Tax=Streptomyces mirabilis TaxID=68239 RepID=UPI00332E4DA8
MPRSAPSSANCPTSCPWPSSRRQPRNRLLQLDADQRPVITPGRTGRITATIRPACLRLLTGTVQQPNRTGTRFDFLLDEASTERLRLDPNNGTRFRIAKDEKRYRLAKVPASCIELTDPADS